MPAWAWHAQLVLGAVGALVALVAGLMLWRRDP